MQKPLSIRLFNAMFWLGVLLNIAAAIVNRDVSVEVSGLGETTLDPNIFLAAGLIILVLVFSALWFFIVRRASSIARWVFTIFAMIMLALTAANASLLAEKMGGLGTTLEIARFAMWVLAALMLFRKDAEDYFRASRSAGTIIGE
ncbi:hypothetical protein VCJ71_09995 [Alteriqipengyuania sp. WL0013]|uniref:hypothetical protein n=1 Tax=Alteriqipengyuania sp. WL0013 TaxID=3110773 RepID=UPI002B5D84D3|nr:hypothetical protein [Alteriqipengyuania sp. WL0013]MEB3416399.1 hypothetical protein [Alteriqipengyuania sp. WL0013]